MCYRQCGVFSFKSCLRWSQLVVVFTVMAISRVLIIDTNALKHYCVLKLQSTLRWGQCSVFPLDVVFTILEWCVFAMCSLHSVENSVTRWQGSAIGFTVLQMVYYALAVVFFMLRIVWYVIVMMLTALKTLCFVLDVLDAFSLLELMFANGWVISSHARLNNWWLLPNAMIS